MNNGQWFATLEVDEVQKNNIPHLFKFACGNRALLTVRGRPPLCLRCHKVGHVRNVREGYDMMPMSSSDESDFIPYSFDVNFPPNRPVKKASRRAGGSVQSDSEGISTSNSFTLLIVK